MNWKRLLLSAATVAALAAIDRIIVGLANISDPWAEGTAGVVLIFVLKLIQKFLSERKEQENW